MHAFRRTETCAGPARGAGGEGGFTLLEILIALVILMVGLVGLMAVFPQAMRTANLTINLSYASAISQSVIDAVALGLREMRLQTSDGRWQAFILDHDGPEHLDEDRNDALANLDPANLDGADGGPSSTFRQLLRRDYCILLPRRDEVETRPGSTPVGTAFHYPRAEPGDNLARVGALDPETTRVFHLGRRLRDSEHENAFTRDDEQRDPYQDYAFAFTLRAANAATVDNPNLDRSRQDIVPGLYELVVKVYRSFQPGHRRLGRPIESAEFTTYVGAR